jgi:hypothetical protein
MAEENETDLSEWSEINVTDAFGGNASEAVEFEIEEAQETKPKARLVQKEEKKKKYYRLRQKSLKN